MSVHASAPHGDRYTALCHAIGLHVEVTAVPAEVTCRECQKRRLNPDPISTEVERGREYPVYPDVSYFAIPTEVQNPVPGLHIECTCTEADALRMDTEGGRRAAREWMEQHAETCGYPAAVALAEFVAPHLDTPTPTTADEAEVVAAHPGLLTREEHEAVAVLADAGNRISRIIGNRATRAGDLSEAVHHIHALQYMVLSQAACRAYPESYRLMGETLPGGHGGD